MFERKRISLIVILILCFVGVWCARAMAQGLCSITQITATVGGASDRPAVSRDGSLIVFDSTSDITGGNADGSTEMFLFNRTSGTITQITDTPAGRLSTRAKTDVFGGFPVFVRNIAFESNANLTGDNADGNTEVFLFNVTGGTFTQITNTIGATNDNVWIGSPLSGIRIVFESNADLVPTVGNADGNTEIFMFDTAAATFTRITDTVGAINNAPSMTDETLNAQPLVVFSSTANLTGNNADGNPEIFLYNIVTGTFTQVTNTAGGAINDNPVIDAGGRKIVLESNADLTAGNADNNTEMFLFDIFTGAFTQITNTTGATRNRNAAIDGTTATRVTFTSDGDLVVGRNADLNDEIFLFVTTTGLLSQITGSLAGGSDNSSMNGTGTLMVFESNSDLVPGGNPEANSEIFMANCAVFEDVGFGYFAFEFIYALFDAGITAGCAANPPGYCPSDSITRAQMAVFIETSLGAAPPACSGTRFTDVTPTLVGQAFCDFIEDFANRGITAGCTPTAFCPEAPVTRAQMAVFIEAALGNSANPCGTRFADVTAASVGEIMCGFIDRLAADGITGGCPPVGSNNFCPNASVTRGEMAVFIAAAPPPLTP